MANMYLGYAYYDIKNWKDAITAFHKVNQENLRGYWEQIKRLELIGCALVEIGKTTKGMKVLENEVISEYEKVGLTTVKIIRKHWLILQKCLNYLKRRIWSWKEKE